MTLPTGRRRSVERGGAGAFTLIELILVMAILMIVLGTAAPQLSRFFRGRVLDSEARQILSLTRYGQSRAVAEGLPMLLWIDRKQRTYGLRPETAATVSSSRSAVSDTDTKTVEHELGRDLEIEAADMQARTAGLGQAQNILGNLPAIRFTPDGYISDSSPRTIWLQEGKDKSDHQMAITLSRNRLYYEIYTNNLQNLRH